MAFWPQDCPALGETHPVSGLPVTIEEAHDPVAEDHCSPREAHSMKLSLLASASPCVVPQNFVHPSSSMYAEYLEVCGHEQLLKSTPSTKTASPPQSWGPLAPHFHHGLPAGV
jgi:hypothetical protein